MALILLCEEDIDPTGSDVRCVRNDGICDIILQLYLSAHCPVTNHSPLQRMRQDRIWSNYPLLGNLSVTSRKVPPTTPIVNEKKF